MKSDNLNRKIESKLESLKKARRNFGKEFYSWYGENNAINRLIKAYEDFLSPEFIKDLSKEEKELLSKIDKWNHFSTKSQKELRKRIQRIKNEISESKSPEYLPNGKSHQIFLYHPLIEQIYGSRELKQLRDFSKGILSLNSNWGDGIVITFNIDPHYNSLETLNKQIKEWLKVLRAFSRLNNDNSSDFQITNIRGGSVIVTVIAVAGTVTTLGIAINHILDAIKKVVEIKKSIKELRKLEAEDIKNAIEIGKLLSEYSHEIELIEETISKDLPNKIIDISKYSKSDFHEVSTAVKKATKYLSKFLKEKGKVKLIFSRRMLNKGNRQILKQKQLKEKDIDKIESNIKQLDGPKEDLPLTHDDDRITPSS